MSRNIPLLYIERDSFLHRRDPRVKIALFFILFVYLFVAPGIEWLLLALAAGLFFAISAGTSWIWLGVLWLLQVPSFTVMILIPLFTHDYSGTGSIYDEISGELRLITAWSAAIFISVSLFSTMEPNAIRQGLKGIGFPGVVALSVALTYRLLYATLEEGLKITEGMKLKGIVFDIKQPGLFVKDLINLCLPLLFSLVRRVIPMTYALENRGNNEHVNLAPLDRGDWLFLLSSITILVLAAFINLSTLKG